MMKTQTIFLSLIIMILMVFSACREIKVTTKVNRDGSFTRIITVTGDSSDVIKTDLPFPVDGTWAGTFSRDTSDSTKFMMIYSKSYRNSKELITEIRQDTGSYKNLERDISVTKRFQFFFSYLNFREVYKSVNPFKILNYKDFLKEDDILWTSGLKKPVNKSDSTMQSEAEDKIMAFLNESATAEVESIIRDGIKRLNNPLLNQVDLSVYHDSLSYKMEKWNFKDYNELIDLYLTWSGNEAFSLLKGLEPPLFEEFKTKMDALETIVKLEGYTEEVEMPGLITATNSAMINGNKVQWDFQVMSAIVRDYEMIVESRVINYWAFILAGCVLLSLVVLLVVKAVRK